jgi:hypothetical protein
MVGCVTGSQGTHISSPMSEGWRRSSHCPDAAHLQTVVKKDSALRGDHAVCTIFMKFGVEDIKTPRVS